MYKSDQLQKIAYRYDREARKCAKARAYLAACILQGAALEALLIAMCLVYPDEVKRTTVYRTRRFRLKRSKALELGLYELVEIAGELGWFPSKIVTLGRRKTTLAQLAHGVRDIRNLVHAGRWGREFATKINKGTYTATKEIFDVAHSWLLHHVEESLRRRMKREGLGSERKGKTQPR